MTLAVVEHVQGEILPAEFDRRLEYAHLKAQSLARIVEAQHLYTDIQGRKHLHVEAWVTIAEGYGYNIDIEWTHPLGGGGYEARAVIKDTTGQTIGHAEAECGSEGDGHWVGRPNFQQRSMAQTRAISKVARNRLAWVVVLAGYSPTPSEEMVASTEDKSEHWCAKHETNWFKRGKMRNFAHSIGDTKEWCNEPLNPGVGSETPAGGRTPSPRPVPPGSSDSPTLTRAQLEDTLTAENMPWDRFELEVLRTSWATFLKTKGASPAVALAKWEAWKNSHPQAQEAPTAPPAGATDPRG